MKRLGLSNKPMIVGLKVNIHEIADNARTHGIPESIGSLYDFTLLVKTETSNKDGFDFVQNRFSVKGKGEVLYHYNNGQLANDPKLAALNFLHALETMPQRLDKSKKEIEKISIEKETNTGVEQMLGLLSGKVNPKEIVPKEFQGVKDVMGDRLVFVTPNTSKGVRI